MHLALAGALGIASRPEVVVTWRDEDARQVDACLRSQRAADRRAAYLSQIQLQDVASARLACNRAVAGRARLRIVLSAARIQRNGLTSPISRVTCAGRDPMPPANSSRGFGPSWSAGPDLCGPDTALTHVAAALGVPTVALSAIQPGQMGPWPRGHAGGHQPWRRCGSQRPR